jgi:type VI protein secretion system component Hcp
MEDNENIIKQGQTYVCLDSENGTKFEVDLITYREKGQQVKYLSISFTDVNENVASLSLNEESFGIVKTFFKQLDWNG